MVRGLKVLMAMLVVAGAIAVGGASADNINGAAKYTLYADQDVWCDLSGFVAPGTATSSFAVLQFDKSLNQVGATVSLKGALPNTTYAVRILQGDFTSCFADIGSITTNSQGNGSTNVTAPATSTTADVFVIDYSSFTFFSSGPTFYNHA